MLHTQTSGPQNDERIYHAMAKIKNDRKNNVSTFSLILNSLALFVSRWLFTPVISSRSFVLIKWFYGWRIEQPFHYLRCFENTETILLLWEHILQEEVKMAACNSWKDFLKKQNAFCIASINLIRFQAKKDKCQKIISLPFQQDVNKHVPEGSLLYKS